MKTILALLLLAFLTVNSFSQKKDIIYLWPGKVPGELKGKQAPVIDTVRNDHKLRINEVTNPSIEVWLPDARINKRAALIVCPGGGNKQLYIENEGTEIAAWLNELGYAAFVLQYRIPNKQEGALQDAQRAVRIVRENAVKWDLDPQKIGIMGFSAGGSLSARACTNFNKKTYAPVNKADSLSCRPSFTILVYPAGLDRGPNGTLTPELQISNETPPFFMFAAEDDRVGKSTLIMAGALRNAKIPVELHYVPTGGHGYALRPGNPAAETWPLFAEKWLTRLLSGNGFSVYSKEWPN